MNPTPPPIVYGELSILGYNGYIPSNERNGRKNKSKFLLCKRAAPNGIKKSHHFIVKQPHETKAIQDKDLYSISFTFSRSQTIVVEYRQDETTDMFQIGRSSEDPIDFVVMDTMTTAIDREQSSICDDHHKSHVRSHMSENNSGSQHHRVPIDGGLAHQNRLNRHLAKVGDELMHGGHHFDHRGRLIDPTNLHYQVPGPAGLSALLHYPQPNLSNLPPMMADHFRSQDHFNAYASHVMHQGLPSGSSHHQHRLIHPSIRAAGEAHASANDRQEPSHGASNRKSSSNAMGKRSNATQSTISRFACRILVDRLPPYTARIYAAGFDSSKNIFLGEKATKWEHDNCIDGLTTNGVLLMHPRRGNFYANSDSERDVDDMELKNCQSKATNVLDSRSADNKININNSGDINDSNNSDRNDVLKPICSTNGPTETHELRDIEMLDKNQDDKTRHNSDMQNFKTAHQHYVSSDTTGPSGHVNTSDSVGAKDETDLVTSPQANNRQADRKCGKGNNAGGIWREVSVDGGIYAIRESRSAAQKGIRIQEEDNILQDGTLIDLCGATLLWRSVDGFKASPTKKSLEEKIDRLNASRPQCPVGLNTLVIPRKPILPDNHRSSRSKQHDGAHSQHYGAYNHGHGNNDTINSHQPYVYLKCGHVQGYHDWGTTERSNMRTCPICLSVGAVAKLSMGLEPSFYVDSGPLTHVFSPCGHMASERTVKYWCSIEIPYGTHFFHSICPFCATPLATNEPPSTRLIFQDDLD